MEQKYNLNLVALIPHRRIRIGMKCEFLPKGADNLSFSADTGIGGTTLYGQASNWIPQTPFSIAHGARGTIGRRVMPRHDDLGLNCTGKSRMQFEIAGVLIGFGKRSADSANLDTDPDADNMLSRLFLLMPSAEDLAAMVENTEAFETRRGIVARQILEIVNDDVGKLKIVRDMINREFPNASLSTLDFMIAATEAADVLLVPTDTSKAPSSIVDGGAYDLKPCTLSLFPTSQDMDDMNNIAEMHETRLGTLAHDMLKLVSNDIKKLECVQEMLNLESFPDEEVATLEFMQTAAMAASILLVPTHAANAPSGMVAEVLADMQPSPLVEDDHVEVVTEPAAAETLEPRVLQEYHDRNGAHIQILEANLHSFQRPVTPEAQINKAHLQRITSDGRSIAEYVVHVKTFGNLVYDSLAEIAKANGLVGTISYLMGAWKNELWVYVRANTALKSAAKTTLIIPDSIERIDITEYELFTFTRQNSKKQKLCEFLMGMFEALHFFHGTIKIAASKITEANYEDVCAVVADMSATEYGKWMAAVVLAVKRKKASDIQQVAFWLTPRLNDFMVIQNTASDTIRYLQNCTVLDADKVPDKFWQTKFRNWNCIKQDFDVYTMHELVFTKAALNFAPIMTGPGQVNKTMMAEIIAKVHTIMRQKQYFIFAGKLDSFGPLTLKGMVADAGCCVFDDCSPKSGPGGGKLLSDDEGKQLFGVRFGTAYTAMYSAAQFAATTPKIFTTNLRILSYTAGQFPRIQCGDLVEHFSWIAQVACGDVEGLKHANVNAQAMARRCAIAYFDECMVPDDVMKELEHVDEDIMKERLRALKEYQAKRKQDR